MRNEIDSDGMNDLFEERITDIHFYSPYQSDIVNNRDEIYKFIFVFVFFIDILILFTHKKNL